MGVVVLPPGYCGVDVDSAVDCERSMHWRRQGVRCGSLFLPPGYCGVDVHSADVDCVLKQA
eukprot:151984-Chlamydomonas_euryale.AAC.1